MNIIALKYKEDINILGYYIVLPTLESLKYTYILQYPAT